MIILIIEDEAQIAQDLADTLMRVDTNIEIKAIVPSVKQGIPLLQQMDQLDLIFSDIQLSDGLSFEIFEQVKSKTPIIFCTAYNEYALEAFRANGIDYLLKPFSKASVAQALEKYKNLRGMVPQTNDYRKILELIEQKRQESPQHILIKKGPRIIPIELQDIALFFIEDQYPFAFTFKGEKYLISQSLEELEQLGGQTFFRVNRQFLVQRKAIKEAVHYFHRKLLLRLSFDYPEKVIV
ncbi:MAG: LytTR family DNA-binding domain-containing protein, partial [Bacteroidota bacterium]